MVNPHEALLASPPPGSSIGEEGAPAGNTGGSGGSSGVVRGQKSVDTSEEGEAEYESSHRRRKASDSIMQTVLRCPMNINLRAKVF